MKTWNIIPILESSEIGVNLQFWESHNWTDKNYIKGIFYYCTFHFLFFLFLTSLIRVILQDPGSFSDEYKNYYSLISFAKNFFHFILNKKERDFNFQLEKKEKSNLEEIRYILSMKDRVQNLFDRKEKIEMDDSKDKDEILPLKRKNSQEIVQRSSFENNNFPDFTYKSSRRTCTTTDEVYSSKDLINDIDKYEAEITNYIESNLDKYDDICNITFNQKDGHSKRFCGYCLIKKPDRTHHCRYCGKCVLSMDHHCPWLAKCIGHKNYKFFFLTIFYSMAILLFIIITSIDGLIFYLNEFDNNQYFFSFIVVFLLILVLCICLTNFFYIHLMLLLFNISTIEHLEKIKESSICRTQYKNIFFTGFYDHLSNILGSSIFIWLLPIKASNEKLRGYQFNINIDILEKMNRLKLEESTNLRKLANLLK